ncbi:MAG: P-loop NTPase fold protein [Wolbachia sp.]
MRKRLTKKDIDLILKELNILKKNKDFLKKKLINKIKKGKSIYILVDDLDIYHPDYIVNFLKSIKYIPDHRRNHLC